MNKLSFVTNVIALIVVVTASVIAIKAFAALNHELEQCLVETVCPITENPDQEIKESP